MQKKKEEATKILKVVGSMQVRNAKEAHVVEQLDVGVCRQRTCSD
jgi:hypothetical protein